MNNKTKQRFSPETLEMLREAGWFPGRDVSSDLHLPPDFTPFPAALQVLKEFGNLVVGREGPGIDFAKTPLVIEPALAFGENGSFGELSALIGSNLYPLGETGNGHSFVAIDEYGRVFVIVDEAYFVEDTFDCALDNLLRGTGQVRPVNAAGRW